VVEERLRPRQRGWLLADGLRAQSAGYRAPVPVCAPRSLRGLARGRRSPEGGLPYCQLKEDGSRYTATDDERDSETQTPKASRFDHLK
jgi:hypothetical protein